MATTNSGAFTVARVEAAVHQDGSCSVTLSYTNASSAVGVTMRGIYIPANAAQPIVDQNGGVISATVPAALATAISTFATQLDTTIASGASGNKLNL